MIIAGKYSRSSRSMNSDQTKNSRHRERAHIGGDIVPGPHPHRPRYTHQAGGDKPRRVGKPSELRSRPRMDAVAQMGTLV